MATEIVPGVNCATNTHAGCPHLDFWCSKGEGETHLQLSSRVVAFLVGSVAALLLF